MKLYNIKLAERFLWGTILGIIFGLFCFVSFSSQPNMPADLSQWQKWSWNNVWMWRTIFNRMILGLVVAIAGLITRCPIFGIKIPIWLRGIKVGFIISLPMAMSSLQNSNMEIAWNGFWIVLILGSVIGALIDIIITRFTGEGKILLK